MPNAEAPAKSGTGCCWALSLQTRANFRFHRLFPGVSTTPLPPSRWGVGRSQCRTHCRHCWSCLAHLPTSIPDVPLNTEIRHKRKTKNSKCELQCYYFIHERDDETKRQKTNTKDTDTDTDTFQTSARRPGSLFAGPP
jgi:hypothetical protein